MRLIAFGVLSMLICATILIVALATIQHTPKRETFSWPAGEMSVQKEVYVCGSKSMDLIRSGLILPKVSICR